MKVNADDIAFLFSVLTQSSDTFGECAERLSTKFGAVLCVGLTCRTLFPKKLRLNALFAAFALFSDTPELLRLHPFLSVFLAVLHPPPRDPSSEPPVSIHEQWLVCMLMLRNWTQLKHLTSDFILASLDPDLANQELQSNSFLTLLNQLKLRSDKFQSQSPRLFQIGAVPAVFALPSTDFDPFEEYTDPTIEEAMDAMIEIFNVDSLEQQLALANFKMPRLIPPPPIRIPGLDEFVLLDEKNEIDPAVKQRKQNAMSLMQKAIDFPLRSMEQQLISNEITEDASFVLECNQLSSTTFPNLVERNPNVAINVLKALLSLSAADEFLNAMLGMSISIHCMDVVNKLASLMKPYNILGAEFMHLYIASICRKCDLSVDAENQARNVRLVCVFIQSLLRNAVIAVEEFEVEMESFCIQYSRYKEASDLFQLLRQAQFSKDA
ncbi:hypothetical protein BJ741DRAFT_669772 [Chytriomyces cf. hyalinus JEL632]|nr:hypothetical protein BJ741DRAFT_669772 [Chytriomyces cf. hyalinus JEL632]